ncbi:hypothetical protein H4R20_003973, partial [Coemansia guatemalensis]
MARHFPYIGIYTLSLTLQTAAVAVAVWLHYKEQLHNRIASTPLLLFWLFSILLSLLRLRTAVSVDYVNDFNGLAYPVALFTVASLAVFSLECQPKPDKPFESSGNDADDVDNSEFGKLENCDDDYCTAGSPEERANVFSRYTYTWVGSLLQKGYHKQLNLEDIWKLTGQYRPDVVRARFQHNWQKELKSSSPSLFRATVRTYWKIWALAAMYEMFNVISICTQLILLSQLIEFAATFGTDQGSPIEYGYFYAVALFLAACNLTFGNCIRSTYAQRLKTLIRTSYMTAIYQKTLALSNDARQKYATGITVTHLNFLSETVAIFFEGALQSMWSDPLRFVITYYLLFRLLGWSTLAGLLSLNACMPIMSHISQTIGTHAKLLMGYRDRRKGIINEMLVGIRDIKVYARESSFIQSVNDVRIRLELGVIRKNNVLKAIHGTIGSLTLFAASFAMFATYALLDNKSHGPLDAQKVFVGIPLLGSIEFVLGRIVRVIPQVINAIFSLQRISDFLTTSEVNVTDIDCQPYNRNSPGTSANDVLVSSTNATFKWSSLGTAVLKDINIQCKRNELVAVIGRVSSGKTSLVSAILGDMIKCAGEVKVCG